MNIQPNSRLGHVARCATSPAILSAAACILGIAIAAGVFLDWTTEASPRAGVSFSAGDVTLGAGLLLITLALGYFRETINRVAFFVLSALAASSALCATMWFWLQTVGKSDPITREYQFFRPPPPIGPGTGWYVSLIASFVALTWISASTWLTTWLKMHSVDVPMGRLRLNIRRRASNM